MELPNTASGIALKRYVEDGVPVGDFLRAVIENDLRGAVSRADDTNLPLISEYVRWLYNSAPALCWGGRGVTSTWCRVGGLNGLESMEPEARLAALHELTDAKTTRGIR